MSRRFQSLPRLLLLSALSIGPALACAQGNGGLRLGVATGSSDYGTPLKGQLSDDLRLPFLRGPWRWEGQATHFGSEDYVQFGATFQRSAWALGVSAMPQLPLAQSLTGYGKVGVHYLHSEASGPGLSRSNDDIKLGLGAGLVWQLMPKLGVKFELENIGGSSGDLITVGIEVPL